MPNKAIFLAKNAVKIKFVFGVQLLYDSSFCPTICPSICHTVRRRTSLTSRERNHPKKAIFCDDVRILDCTISISNVLDGLDLKNNQKEANMVIFKSCLKVRSFTFFYYLYIHSLHSLSSSLSIFLSLSISIYLFGIITYPSKTDNRHDKHKTQHN